MGQYSLYTAVSGVKQAMMNKWAETTRWPWMFLPCWAGHKFMHNWPR